MTSLLLNRRTLLAAMPFLCAAPGRAAATPYRARIFVAGFDGTAYAGGLHIQLDPGWKTYWRVPGEGGIPPSVEAAGANVASFRFDCPLPHRIQAGDGESIGYKDEVVFPWALTPADAGKPVDAAFSAFVGVCESVCIPVPLKSAVSLLPADRNEQDAALLKEWLARVPQPGSLVTAAVAGEEGGAVHVDIQLSAHADDIFTEGNALHFYATPVWNEARTSARIPVHGAKGASELRGTPLRMTIAIPGGGLEQTVTVS